MSRTIEDILNPEKFSVEEIIALEKRYMAPCIGHYYKEPLFIARGKGALLYDNKGKEYIDLFAGICTAPGGKAYAYQHLVSDPADGPVRRKVDLYLSLPPDKVFLHQQRV